MLERHRVIERLAVVMLLAVLRPGPFASSAETRAAEQDGRVAGIMFDFDRDNNWLTVKADGEEAPVKYLIDPSNKTLAEGLKTVFNASRVRLTYRMEGDARRLVSIRRHIVQASGTVTGVVVKVHNDFWIELKPKNGVANAFAPGANYNDKDFMAKLRGLKPGDSVTIQFTTDSERHRILALRKNAAPGQPGPRTEQQRPPGKVKS
jgi:hypothetical protein